MTIDPQDPPAGHRPGPRIVIVPGLAVRSYAVPAADRIVDAGYPTELLPAFTWRGTPGLVGEYAGWVADRLRAGPPVDLLVGLSLGTQVAALAATRERVGHLLLVSPTIDPARRSRPRLLRTWLRGDQHPAAQSLAQQIPDWRRAGIVRIHRGLLSALQTPVETVLPKVTAPVTIAHAGWDNLTSFGFAASLASRSGARLLELPAASHSWPIGDTDGFLRTVRSLVGEAAPTS